MSETKNTQEHTTSQSTLVTEVGLIALITYFGELPHPPHIPLKEITAAVIIPLSLWEIYLIATNGHSSQDQQK